MKQARELNSFTQTELAARLVITQSSVAQIESGRLSPSDELLQRIALQTRFPPSFFRQAPDDDFPLGSLLFRSKAATTTREENSQYRWAQVGYRIMAKLLAKTQLIPLRLPRVDDDLPETAADVTRAALGLSPDQPIGHLINTMERGGILGLTLPVESGHIDAFSSWVGPKSERPLVVMTRAEGDGARMRWNVAHELAHLVMHRAVGRDLAEVESEANRFAGQFLMPEITIREELLPPVTLVSVAGLKQRWGVSMQALIMRALELEIITPRQRKYLFQQLSMRGWRTREPKNLDIDMERPQSLPQLATLFYGDPIDCARLARHTNVRKQLVEEFITAHGGVVPQRPASRDPLSFEQASGRS